MARMKHQAFSVIGLLLIIKAAPIMLGLAASHSPDAVERAFDEFHFWGLLFSGFCRRLGVRGPGLGTLRNLTQPAN